MGSLANEFKKRGRMMSRLPWTEDMCKRKLTRDRIDGSVSREKFWDDITKWHVGVYEKGAEDDAHPIVYEWADQSVETMQRVEKEMGLDVEAPQKKSVFGRIKQ